MKTRFVLHPILLGLYPVLFAYAHNIDFAPPRGEIIVLLALFGGCAALLCSALTGMTGDLEKTAIGVSLFTVLFFSYGHLTKLIGVPLSEFRIFSLSFGENRAPAFVWIAVVLIAARWLRNLSREGARTVTLVLNRAGLALVLLVTLSLATSVFTVQRTVA